MKKFMLAAIVFALFSVLSRAQETPQVEIAGGYSHLEVTSGFSISMDGGSGSAAYNFNNWIGAAGDFGAYHGSPGGVSLNVESYTFGPRFSYRNAGRFVPFAQALLGGSHATGARGGFSASSNAFAFGFGGGADIGLGSSRKVALRPQVEYFGFHSSGSTTNSVRLSMGIVYRIGKMYRHPGNSE